MRDRSVISGEFELSTFGLSGRYLCRLLVHLRWHGVWWDCIFIGWTEQNPWKISCQQCLTLWGAISWRKGPFRSCSFIKTQIDQSVSLNKAGIGSATSWIDEVPPPPTSQGYMYIWQQSGFELGDFKTPHNSNQTPKWVFHKAKWPAFLSARHELAQGEALSAITIVYICMSV